MDYIEAFIDKLNTRTDIEFGPHISDDQKGRNGRITEELRLLIHSWLLRDANLHWLDQLIKCRIADYNLEISEWLNTERVNELSVQADVGLALGLTMPTLLKISQIFHEAMYRIVTNEIAKRDIK